jgi:hypothetical protein
MKSLHRAKWVVGLWCVCAAMPVSAFDAAYKPIDGGAWNVDDGPIPYFLNQAGSKDINDGSDLQTIRDAFRAWQCVKGTKVRVQEQASDGPAAVADDGKNALFWDETGAVGMGPATLGVTIGDATPGQLRKHADIAFNGADDKWSTDDGPTATDVGSIAVHEIGHFFGLDHPCDKPGGQETNCNGADRSVMTPVWNNGILRTPLPDDEAGIRALYPLADGDKSSCDGPFHKGERCSCDGECVDGLICIPGEGGDSVCAATCSANASDCGHGFACVLGVKGNASAAPGTCLHLADAAKKPAGAVCISNGECDSGTCTANLDVGRSVCLKGCKTDSDCDASNVCDNQRCLGTAADGNQCPDPNKKQGCGCNATEGASSPFGGVGGSLALAVLICLNARSRRGRGAL